jgi:hypothetical protein
MAQQPEAPETTEADDAAEAFDSWLGWIAEARDSLYRGGGDPEDIDGLLALVLDYVATETETAVALGEERATQRAEEILRETKDSNRRLAVFLRQQRLAHEAQAIEAKTLAERLVRVDETIATAARENVALRSSLSDLAQAHAGLEKELARERALRRLLDAQRSRPHTQRVASELAKRHAERVLQSAMKKETA